MPRGDGTGPDGNGPKRTNKGWPERDGSGRGRRRMSRIDKQIGTRDSASGTRKNSGGIRRNSGTRARGPLIDDKAI